MNSDEFSHLIGNNYGNVLHQAPVDNFVIAMEEANSLNTNDVMYLEPLSPNTLQRFREQNNLIANDGSEREDIGPTISSKNSTKALSPSAEEVNSVPQPHPLNAQGMNSSHTSHSSLEILQSNFVFQNGVLSLTNPITEPSTTNVGNAFPNNTNVEPIANVTSPQIISWKDEATKNIPNVTPSLGQTKVTFNENGSTIAEPPREFLLHA